MKASVFKAFIKCAPQVVVRWGRGGDGNHLLADRVLESEGPGMQADATVRVGTGKTVFQVSFDGATDFGKLATDLVVPSGVEDDFQQIISL